MTEDIHSCSYFCTRPACVLAQRDELRDSHGAGNQVPPPVGHDELARLREQWAREADPFTYIIQHLNSNPYSLTKDECIHAIKELRSKYAVAPPAQPAPEQRDVTPQEDSVLRAAALRSATIVAGGRMAQPAAQPVQRLSDERIDFLADRLWEEGHIQSLSKDSARIFARAIEAALQPQGWVLVPMEPYPSQRIAGTAEWMRQSAQDDDPDTDKTAAVYRAMIAARPDAS